VKEAQERLREADEELDDLAGGIDLPKPPEAPEAEVDEDAQSPLVDLDWGFEGVMAALKAHKAYEGQAEDEGLDEDGEDGDDDA
jgi:hypothetical protein